MAGEPAVTELQPETAPSSTDGVTKDERLPTTPTRSVPSARKSYIMMCAYGKHIAHLHSLELNVTLACVQGRI